MSADQVMDKGQDATRDGHQELIAWAPPFILGTAMLIVAITVSRMARVEASALILPYLYASFGMTVLACLVFTFFEVAQMARQQADHPLHAVFHQLRTRARLLLLPAIIFPLFLAAFTTAKTGIPFLVGYDWEKYWAEADAAIFGADVWRLAQLAAPYWSLPWWEYSYTFGWGAVTYFAAAYLTIKSDPTKVLIFFTATFATWLTGGWLMAYSTSAAGPIFAHLADPTFQERFRPLHEFLAANLSENGPIRFSQRYLELTHLVPVALKGGGISAMPSMHLAMAALLVIAAWRSAWFLPAIIFWLVIFIGSGLFGYHYWIDGLAGAAIAAACWWAASAYYRQLSLREPVAR